MPRQLWLADAARRTGYPVTEVVGWQTRGLATFAPHGLVWHHTAGKATGDMPTLNTLINGRTGLPGPLAQYGLGRSGRIYVVAAGLANHAGEGDWHGLTGNSSVVGIEAEHVGISGVPWPAVQLDAYRKLAAEILQAIQATTHHMCAHREWARNRTVNRKVDPIDLNMDAERSAVDALMQEGVTMWTRDLDEAGWRALARSGIAAGGEAAVVKYWVTEGADRTLAEHATASANMMPLMLANLARFTDNTDTTGGGGVTPTDLSAAIATHAKASASASVHPHRHDEGATGGPLP